MSTMVANITERWGKVQGWFGRLHVGKLHLGKFHAPFAGREKRQLFERAIEYALVLAWPFLAYQAVFNRYEWNSAYYNKWGESWFALVLLIAMAGPLVFRLFSGTEMDLQKRCALGALLLFGVGLGIKFRPVFGGVSLMGFFVPMALYAAAVFLWLLWPTKKPSPTKHSRERVPATRGDTEQSKRN